MEYEKAFALISEPVEKFAKKNNLIIEKYRYEAPSWILCFRRKIGGIGYIYINYLYRLNEEQGNFGKVSFEIVLIWVLDDYDTETRNSVRRQISIFNFEQNSYKITDLLNQALDVIKKLQYNDLENHNKGMNWKNHYKTKENFMQSIIYPELDI